MSLLALAPNNRKLSFGLESLAPTLMKLTNHDMGLSHLPKGAPSPRIATLKAPFSPNQDSFSLSFLVGSSLKPEKHIGMCQNNIPQASDEKFASEERTLKNTPKGLFGTTWTGTQYTKRHIW